MPGRARMPQIRQRPIARWAFVVLPSLATEGEERPRAGAMESARSATPAAGMPDVAAGCGMPRAGSPAAVSGRRMRPVTAAPAIVSAVPEPEAGNPDHADGRLHGDGFLHHGRRSRAHHHAAFSHHALPRHIDRTATEQRRRQRHQPTDTPPSAGPVPADEAHAPRRARGRNAMRMTVSLVKEMPDWSTGWPMRFLPSGKGM